LVPFSWLNEAVNRGALPFSILCVEITLDDRACSTEIPTTLGDHRVATPAGAELGRRDEDGPLVTVEAP
jgi:hypothetical protein